MIFEYDNELKEICFNEINLKYYTVAYISASEFEAYHNLFGFDEVAYEKYKSDGKNFRSKIEANTSYSYGTIKIIEPEIDDKTEINLAFYVTKKLVLFIDTSNTANLMHGRFCESAERVHPSEYCCEKFIFAFIDSIIGNDNKCLEDIELEINRMEDRIIKEKEYKNFNEEILKYKRKLMSLRNFYEQIIDIGEALIENENGIFEEDNLIYFRSFINKSERLCTNVNLLRENLLQLRETYQSTLDLRLNNTMKLFTVLTAVFSPLTLIAGWYGMNFKFMPELGWKYGYFYVIALSITVFVTCIIIFKKKKLI